jgi:hypothetical protein
MTLHCARTLPITAAARQHVSVTRERDVSTLRKRRFSVYMLPGPFLGAF